MRSRAISKKILKSRKVVIRRPQGSRRHTDTAAVGAGRGTGDRPARPRPAGAASGPLGAARSLAASQTPAVRYTSMASAPRNRAGRPTGRRQGRRRRRRRRRRRQWCGPSSRCRWRAPRRAQWCLRAQNRTRQQQPKGWIGRKKPEFEPCGPPRTHWDAVEVAAATARWAGEVEGPPPDANTALSCSHGMGAAETISRARHDRAELAGGGGMAVGAGAHLFGFIEGVKAVGLTCSGVASSTHPLRMRRMYHSLDDVKV